MTQTAAAYLDSEGLTQATNPQWDRHAAAHSGRGCACLISADCLAAGEAAAEAGWTHAAKVLAGLRAVLAGARERFTLEYPCAADGHRRWFAIEAIAGTEGGALVSLSNVTDERERAGALSARPGRDALTGLPNRVSFLEHAASVLASSAPSGAGPSAAAIAFLDLDGFHVLADALGREDSDLLLTHVATRLEAALAPGEVVARVGVEEFAALVRGCGPTEAAARAETLLGVLDTPLDLNGRPVSVRASAGVAVGDPSAPDPEALLADAHLAVFRAKQLGPGRCVRFQPELRDAGRRRAELESELRLGIEREELILYYQPKVLLDGTVVGAEALVRWAHPERGLVPPNDFIPLAEETGLIADLGAWALRDACRQAAAWRADGHDLPIAVNVSPLQMRDPGFALVVASALAEHGLPGCALCLEVTESAFGEGRQDILPTLFALRDLGVELALDDFGTGWSSLARLRDLPLDVLKVDRAFVGNLDTDAANRAVVGAIIDLAHSLGLRVVAEGIETGVCGHELERLGCDFGQGFFYGRPVPHEDFPLDPGQLLAA